MKLILIFFTLLSFRASGDTPPGRKAVFQNTPNYCHMVLMSFLNSRLSERDFLEIKEHHDAASDISQRLATPLTPAGYLAPLFRDQGVVYRALQEELQSQGYKTQIEMRNALTVFSSSDDAFFKIDFVKAVIQRVVSRIGTLDISTDLAKIKTLEPRRTEFALSLPDFMGLLKSLKGDEESEFATLRLTLLLELEHFSSSLVDRMPKEERLLSRFKKAPKKSEPTSLQQDERQNQIQARKMIGLKLRYLVNLTNDSQYGAQFLIAVKLIQELMHYLPPQEQRDSIFYLIDLSRYVESDVIFQACLDQFYSLAVSKNDFSLPILGRLQSLSEIYSKENSNRVDLLRAPIKSLEEANSVALIKIAIQGKIEKLKKLSTEFSGFDFDQTFQGELADIEVRHVKKLTDDELYPFMKPLIELLQKVEKDDVFISEFQRLTKIVNSFVRCRALWEQQVSEMEWDYLRVNTARYTYIHEKFYKGGPPPTFSPTRRAEEIAREKAAAEAQANRRREADHYWSCFIAGTLVDTPQGRRPIEALKAGDEIFSFDLSSQKIVVRHVLKPLVHFQRQVSQLGLSNGVQVSVTLEHRFYSPSHDDFVSLNQLESGRALLLRVEEGDQTQTTKAHILHKVPMPGLYDVYNLEVEGEHNYFANGILVHNGGKSM